MWPLLTVPPNHSPPFSPRILNYLQFLQALCILVSQVLLVHFQNSSYLKHPLLNLTPPYPYLKDKGITCTPLYPCYTDSDLLEGSQGI